MSNSQKPSPVVDRRQFIKGSALAGGGLLVGTYLRFGRNVAYAQTAPAANAFAPNAFISIAPSGAVSIIAPNSEMGQGIKTGLPMIVAEELDVPWESVTIVQGDLNPAYGRQSSVGSGSTMSHSVCRRTPRQPTFETVQPVTQWKVFVCETAGSACTSDHGSETGLRTCPLTSSR